MKRRAKVVAVQKQTKKSRSVPKADKKKRASADEDMFASYGRLEIHKAMLEDVPRTDAYRQAVVAGRAKHFLGKTVLDVGCGVGILSLFAARLGGANRVYAVEACAETAARARRVVSANGLSHVIKVICGTMESVVLPSKVDTIISEWMGYFMVHESMLDSVLFARDRWLRKGGALYPDRCRVLACPGDFRPQMDKKAGFWGKNVYGFNLSVLKEEAESLVRAESPFSDYCKPGQLLSKKPCVVADWDLASRPRSDIRIFKADFVSTATSDVAVNGFGLWFDVSFPTEPAVVLSTGPRDPRTHWGQTLCLVDQELKLRRGDSIDWTISIAENQQNHRFYDLNVEYGPA